LAGKTVSSLRIGYIFYLSERLRAEFAALNRALKMWTGKYGDEKDIIREITRADPQNLRLALDPQIDLFGLVNDKESSQQRAELNRLASFWAYLSKVTEDVCASLHATPQDPKI